MIKMFSVSAETVFRRARDGFISLLFGFLGVIIILIGGDYSHLPDIRISAFFLPIFAGSFGVIASPDPKSSRGPLFDTLKGAIAGLIVGIIFYLLAFNSLSFPFTSLATVLSGAPWQILAFSSAAGAITMGWSSIASTNAASDSRIFSLRAFVAEESAPMTATEILSAVQKDIPIDWSDTEFSDSFVAMSRSGGVLLIIEPAVHDIQDGNDDNVKDGSTYNEWIIAFLWDPGWRFWLFFDFFRHQIKPRELSRKIANTLPSSGHFSRVDILS